MGSRSPASIRSPPGLPALRSHIGDAGAFLRFMNVYSNAYGGVLRVSGQE